jgi:hypothetical protein
MTAQKHHKRLARDLAAKIGVPYATALRMIRLQGSDSPGDSSAQGHAFVSYVREDLAKVEWLEHMLEAAGIPVWRDKTSLRSGDDWPAEIRNAISRDAQVFIACFSSHSAARQESYMNEELLLAIERLRLRRPHDPWLMSVRFDECKIPEFELGAGRTLASIQSADLFGASRDKEAEKLVAAVQRLFRQHASPVPRGPSVAESESQSGARRRLVPEPEAIREGHKPVTNEIIGTAIRNTDASRNRIYNADAPWNTFSSHDYWRRNYSALQAEDQDIIRRVSRFFIDAFTDRPPAQRGIDVGSGTNLYPALLMLPWTEQILLTDFSASNIRWLNDQLADDTSRWAWLPFWQEMCEARGYREVDRPRKMLREACVSEPGYAGTEQRSVFDLPGARWDLGTMFFVAESITEEPAEFRAVIGGFVGALKPGAPFAAAFTAGSDGYPVGGTRFPAVPITADDVGRCFTGLGARKLSVELLETEHRVKDGYAGMILATGFSRGR